MSKWRTRTRQTIATLAITTSLAAAAPLNAAEPFDKWDSLAAIQIREVVIDNVWQAKKTFPEELLTGREGFTIEGYYVPIEAQAYVQSFLMVRDPADCPFCGTNGYGPTLEVKLKRPMKDIEPMSLVTVKGELQLIDDPETYMAYRLLDGAVLE